MDTKKIIAGILGGATLIGGTYTLTVQDVSQLTAEVAKIKEEKKVILKENIWQSARLNEIPKWDISVVSAEEMSQAYLEKAKELNAKETPNLFENLQVKTIKQGVNCLK